MVRTVLVLGGTTEARRLAEALAPVAELRVVTSLAGRVSRPHLPPGEVRIGGFDGVPGLLTWLRDEHVAAVVDATHPFAARITASAATATAELGLPFLVLRRPGWRAVDGDDWRWVDSVAEAAELLPSVGTRALLTVGRQELAPFVHISDVWLLARSIEQPNVPVRAMLARGPFTVESELDLLRAHDIDVLVTKDSGGDDAKLVAARRLGIPVVIVRRPLSPAVTVVSTVDQAANWVIYGHATVA
ncbi:cobalt-precorrin-6A reductase [Kutzneria chonburiensis]|uniref:Cobalt-precorrin-6A reductase n=1 Tax=Kutzneria chonburiensis TaxID=1483604 RepID=A0ABV6MTH5_9PSEU|nr:cobalt-precorrin-6A reductase [Kutzneria chonburiensis]